MTVESNTTQSTHFQERVNILGVGLSAANMDSAIDFVLGCISERTPIYVSVCPVYTLMQGFEHPDLRKVLNHAGLVTLDGMPLVLLSRLKGYHHVDRVYGPDLMLRLSEYSVEYGIKHYYYGGGEGVPEQLADTLQARYPGLNVVGTVSPPFRELTDEEQVALIADINAADPDIVWVGLGSPKQDFWMARYREQINAPVLIGVGAAFDFHTGRILQAPHWIQQAALEWLFRLVMEPRRLWRRYVIYNPKFLWHVLLQETGLRNYTLE